MADITVQAFGGEIRPTGTTNIGKEQAAAALTGVEDLKSYTAGGQAATISGTAMMRAPKGSNLSGQLNFAPTFVVDSKFKFIIDTRDNTDPVNVVLFDNLKLHSNECRVLCPGGSGGSGAGSLDQTKIYFEKMGDDCGYEAFINEICSRTYLFTSLRFKPKAESGHLLQTSIPITVSHRSIKGRTTGEDNFSTDDHESSEQTRDIFTIPLMGDTAVLSKYTAWILEGLEPNHVFTFELTTAAGGLAY